ncbi:EscU/YscU/HrcU family type III secretion system export apparatus switch protein [Pseudooceanicola sp. C21-150M6]|uniref:EscU/YscU/HrcU family type III secretion system export apparatus switch protein n=1 Tax=Pseudooceanicola sp. C21-150M6 TaxID=3434355 RepID=UPI003D7F70C2
MSDEANQDKPHEPTAKKLNDARKKGEVARSQDISVAMAFLGFTVACVAFGAGSIQNFGTVLMHPLTWAVTGNNSVPQLRTSIGMSGMFAAVLMPLIPFFALPAGFVLISIILQRAFIVTPSKVSPKVLRISVLSNAKNKFGVAGFVEFGKSFTKLLIFSVLLFVYIWMNLAEFVGLVQAQAVTAAVMLLRSIVEMLMIVVVISLAIGVLDYLWQRSHHLRKNRMSDKELRDEQKEAEGDPHLKGERRARALAVANNQMMSDVRSADVVVTNPTHFSVALKWTRQAGAAPVCVAKGKDEVALAIRRVAEEHSVPIHQDPPTARSLYAAVEIGAEIDPELYGAVAVAIRFADDMRRRARSGWA